MKKAFLIFISILLGSIFIFSAYTKLFPIELFEYTFVDTGLFNWVLVPYVSRLAIGLEFFLGILLLLNVYFEKKQTILFALFLLLFFTVYLIVLIVKDGNSGNCGCFGDTLKFTPLESIFKNLGMLILTLILYFKHPGIKFKFQKWLVAFFFLGSFSIPFILLPVNLEAFTNSQEQTLNYQLDLSALYAPGKKNQPKENLREGKRIIAFLSLTCPHCKLGAYKLHLIHKLNPAIPIYFILNGESENLNAFFEESKAADMRYSFMTADEGFVRAAGVKLPAILWVNNGIVEKKVKYKYLKQEEIEAWLSAK